MKLLTFSIRVFEGISQYQLKICHVKKHHHTEGEKAFVASTTLLAKDPLCRKVFKMHSGKKKKENSSL